MLAINTILHNLPRSSVGKVCSQIRNYVYTCVSCRHSKCSATKPAGVFQPLHVCKGPTSLVCLRSKLALMQLLWTVDGLTKYAHLAPISAEFTAQPGLDCSCTMFSAITAFYWKSFLVAAFDLLATTLAIWLIDCTSPGPCPMPLTRRLMVKL